MVEEDVLQQVYSLRGTVYRMWGQLRGQTLLPLPFGFETLKEAERLALNTLIDLSLLDITENSVFCFVFIYCQAFNVSLLFYSFQLPYLPNIKITIFVLKFFSFNIREGTDKDAFQSLLLFFALFSLQKSKSFFRNLQSKYILHFCQSYQSMERTVAMVGMMSNILEVTESAYYRPFVRMCTDFEALESAELSEATALLEPLIHCICILWAKCRSFRKPDRIVTLFKEVTNLLISMVRSFIGVVGFQAETQEPLFKIRTSISLIEKYRELFDKHRQKISEYFEEGQDIWTWEFHPKQAFGRLEKFLTRLQEIKNIFEIAKEFLKIEKIEFGGPKGKVLGTKISAIYSEFNESYTAFSIATYDCLDPEELQFIEGYKQFCNKLKKLEQRLSLVVSQALKKTQTPESFFKF
ncbi:Dynein beta chain, flagellar outer arm [Armadillidium nasatum]|uniref:Dynein beta chain, flagellar outer arm n=1 Tax=Armadillidium nasatum TaxID=96803 RepID=A0A5N5SKI6_9CRUS|nr:Dynein beta chain, flagellar outer arm [Armadillidium nasatum]